MWHALMDDLRADANERIDASAIVVPRTPSVEMMSAALDARDVLATGDRLTHYVRIPEDAETLALPPDLEARFGRERAFALTVMRDIWWGSLSGLDEWLVVRGRQADLFASLWLRPEPMGPFDRPSEPRGETFSYGFPREVALRLAPACLTAPLRSASIMALRAAQVGLVAAPWHDVGDAFEFGDVGGRVPREEVCHRLTRLSAHAWFAATNALGAAREHTPMGHHRDEAGYVLNFDGSYELPTNASSALFSSEPWSALRVTSRGGSVSATANADGTFDWAAEQEGGRSIRVGRDPAYGKIPKELRAAVRNACRGLEPHVEVVTGPSES